MPLLSALEDYFEFRRLGTTWRTEVLAGVTTFVTMAYIIVVNPSILHEAGMPFQAVLAATCISAAFGSIMMGAFARYPIALAPGMGLNAYFTYSVVKGLGIPWQVALGAVFVSGIAFLGLTAIGVRKMIFSAIPHDLYGAVAVGIGLFIAFIGLRNSGIIAANPATLVALGDLRQPATLLSIFGLLLTAGLYAWGVSGGNAHRHTGDNRRWGVCRSRPLDTSGICDRGTTADSTETRCYGRSWAGGY